MEPVEMTAEPCLADIEVNAMCMALTDLMGSGAGKSALEKLLKHLNESVLVMKFLPVEPEPEVIPTEPTAV